MSKRFDIQDATTILIHKPGVGAMLVVSNTTPTNSQANFGVGCLWINHGGSTNTILYINNGSATSSTWVNIF